jgi:hypothetical protein
LLLEALTALSLSLFSLVTLAFLFCLTGHSLLVFLIFA